MPRIASIQTPGDVRRKTRIYQLRRLFSRVGALRLFWKTLGRLRESEFAFIVIAALTGIAVGVGVAVLTAGVTLLHKLLFGVPLNGHLSYGVSISLLTALLVPAAGGLLAGIYSYVMRRLRPRDIVDPIEANALYGGRMSLLDSMNLAVLTIIAVGFGGSAGMEAAYTQAGSGLASKVGRSIRLRRQDLRILVGCGSAAAISAAFNSPLAGAFYAFELVIGSYTPQSIAPVAVASLCGKLAIVMLGQAEPLFTVASPITLSETDYELFLLLGLGAAALSIGTMRAVTIVEHTLRTQHVPSWLRPAVGGLAVGAIAMLFPQVLGSGHGAISSYLSPGSSYMLLFALVLAKMLASALTVGSGMRGGLFSSSLLLGTIFGTATATLLLSVAPGLDINVTTYSLVGMAAVAGGIVGAPVTMTLLVLETTGNFSLTAGVLLTVIVTTFTVRKTFGYSFATWRFHIRGLDLRGAHDVGWIRELTVGKLMRRDFHQVPASETIASLREKFPVGGPKYAFVVDDNGAYAGTIETLEAHAAKFEAEAGQETVDTLIHTEPVALTEKEDIRSAMLLFRKTASEVLPAVENRKSRRLVGYVTEAYLLRRYSQELEKQQFEQGGGVFSPKSAA
jgi:CIC family chloride channel protein